MRHVDWTMPPRRAAAGERVSHPEGGHCPGCGRTESSQCWRKVSAGTDVLYCWNCAEWCRRHNTTDRNRPLGPDRGSTAPIPELRRCYNCGSIESSQFWYKVEGQDAWRCRACWPFFRTHPGKFIRAHTYADVIEWLQDSVRVCAGRE